MKSDLGASLQLDKSRDSKALYPPAKRGARSALPLLNRSCASELNAEKSKDDKSFTPEDRIHEFYTKQPRDFCCVGFRCVC